MVSLYMKYLPVIMATKQNYGKMCTYKATCMAIYVAILTSCSYLIELYLAIRTSPSLLAWPD